MSTPAPEAAQTAPAGVADPAMAAAAPEPAQQQPAQAADTTDWKAEARKHEARAKENAKAAARLAELEAAQMSDAEKSAKAQKDLERQASEARAENFRLRAALQHGISDENLDLLGSGTEEEITARAERIGALEDALVELAALKGQQAAANTPGPVPALTPGAPVAPDTSYPPGWFPSLRAQDTTPPTT